MNKPIESKYALFLSNSFGHKKVVDRVEGAVQAGFEVHLVCYNKADLADARERLLNLCKTITLIGVPRNGSHFRRIGNWLFAYYKVASLLWLFGRPKALIVNTAEFLIFASLLPLSCVTKIYDIADLNPFQYAAGPLSRAFRALEKLALKRGWNIVVSSPWFYWDFFVKLLSVSNPAILIENKLSNDEFTSLVRAKKRCARAADLCVIGWSGILRCNTSMKLLLDLCKEFPGIYRIDLIGITDSIDRGLIDDARSCTDFRFLGKYDAPALGVFLADVDYVWSCDFDDGLNSRTLLPNRLYQAIASSKPCIGYADSASGKIIRQFGIGLIFDKITVVQLHHAINSIDASEYLAFQSNSECLAENVFIKNEFEELFLSQIFESKKLPYIEDLSFVLV